MKFAYRFLVILLWAIAMGAIVYFIGVALGDSSDTSSIRGVFVSIGSFGVGCIRWWKTREK